MVIMAERVNPSAIPLAINSGLYIQPSPKLLPLSINRRLGSLDSYTYVYAGKLPLRIEHNIRDKPPASALSLSIDRAHSTVLPARYVTSKSLPLSIKTPIADQSAASSLPLDINRELRTHLASTAVKPKAQEILQSNWQSSAFGDSAARHSVRVLGAVGFNSAAYGRTNIRADIVEGYFPPSRLKLPIAVSLGIRPPSSELPLGIYREHGQWLNRPDIVVINRRYVYPKTFVDGAVSAPNISLDKQYALGVGIDSLNFGASSVKSGREFLEPVGWQSSSVSAGVSVINRNQRITTQGFDTSDLSKPLIYNLTQYRSLTGFDTSRYGNAYLLGGVKYLTPNGINSNAIGNPDLVNTTADQTAKPTGINSLAISAPIVSPRIVYAVGVATPPLGMPDVRDPAVKPIGEQHTTYGKPTIWFYTRPLAPTGVLSFEPGYLKIADPTQFVLAPSLIESAIFGDTGIKNKSTKVSVTSINDSSFSDYATLTNSNRSYAPKGIDSLSMGAALIFNKTPSIFFDSITPYDVGMPAIGHAIRYVQPTGFDHLLFGRPVLTKTPELLPRGHQSSVVGQAWISHKNRDIELSQKGIDSFRAGTQTIWYGQRPIKTSSWLDSKYGQPVLTHEVREVIAQGFRRDAYGTAWVSQGSRFLEPAGIYKDFPSNHMVGGTQEIKPAGYEATLWGERIIPIGQSIQPLGFGGVFGNATIDLYTRYLQPVGYISVGQQPSDRWGGAVVYNKLQYIVQEYDVNSGLVPPKWSDYLLVANRNIQMNVTGFASQRFGYSQIDNNAAPLLPEAITPPPITIGMVSHGIRSVAPEAIEAPPILDWNVINNDARVIAPLGHAHTQWGNDSSVINTRREYRNVGRIESLEMGATTIGHRIRTIDIELRYSIEPPQINLPTIDLYTRYVSFNGYETVKYGLPSLSIHFNIIGPSWAHRDKFGESVVRNVTPELQVGAFDSQEFGNTGIRTQWRHVFAQGDTATLFGSASIRDKKQTITTPGWQDGGSSQNHTVIKTGAPPYTPQNIWLQNESDPSKNGFGIEPSSAPSQPGLNQNVIYHQGHNSQKFGEAIVYSNNLYIEIGISIKNIEVGPSVKNKNRFVDVKGIDNTIVVSKELGVTPFYIRPRSFNQPYDDWSFDRNSKFGSAVVTNQHRSIYPQGHASSIVGNGGSVTLQTRYIEPPTIRSFSMGFPAIPFTPKTIDMTEHGFNSERHGDLKAARPPYTGPQTIGATGFNGFNSGNQRIELLNRQLLAAGRESLRMGVSVSNDTPYMWQGLRVGEFISMIIGAGDTSAFGEAQIGLRVREIPVDGFVAFRSEYEPIRFKDRMKVQGTITDNVLTQGVTAVGIESQVIGSSGVKLGQQFIRPDGNSDQFRKGGYHA